MGFGFNLFFILVLLPLSAVLLVIGLFSWSKGTLKLLGYIWLGVIGLVFISSLLHWLAAKKELNKKDYYGQYIIDRNYFPGRQANWQYEHYRFEIKKNDSIYFYVTDRANILQTYKGAIYTVAPYSTARLALRAPLPGHHILHTDPTIYRSAWSFYLVFNSPRYGNMFFRKGHWKQSAQ